MRSCIITFYRYYRYMKRLLMTIVTVLYFFGTSSLFHAFAMHHTHSHGMPMNSSAHGMHMAHEQMSDVNCNDNNDCSKVCSLVEASKVGLSYSPVQPSRTSVYYTAFSLFLPPVESMASRQPYEDYTIHKTYFSIMLVGKTVLVI